MKILKIIHGFPPYYNAGSEVYSQSICNELKKQNTITVLTREENPYTADHTIRRETKDGIEFYIINKAREKDGYRHSHLDFIVTNLLDEIMPDIAHIGHLNHLSTGIVQVLHDRKIPIVFTLHDFWLMCPRGQFLQVNFNNSYFHQLCNGQENEKCAINCYNRYFSGVEAAYHDDLAYWTKWVATRMAETRSIIDKVDIFIAPSHYLRNRFITDFGVPEHKIIYLDYGFPLHYLEPCLPKVKPNYTFGYIGTHIPAKGIDLLIEAFSNLNVPATLKIWGRSAGQSTGNLEIQAAKSQHTIQFMGEYVNRNLAQTVFTEVDCIVVPSIWGENSPLVIHEAQACQIPVITADFGGMSEYVEHLVNGLLFTHRDKDSLLEQLTFAAQHPALMQTLGKRAYLNHDLGLVPDIKMHCAELEKLYANLL